MLFVLQEGIDGTAKVIGQGIEDFEKGIKDTLNKGKREGGKAKECQTAIHLET